MKLETFVSETITQVINGVVEAQKSIKEPDAVICPYLRPQPSNSNFLTASPGNRVVQMIDFDVAVTTTEGKGTSGGVGVFVGPM